MDEQVKLNRELLARIRKLETACDEQSKFEWDLINKLEAETSKLKRENTRLSNELELASTGNKVLSRQLSTSQSNLSKVEGELSGAFNQVLRVHNICQRWYNEELCDLEAITLVDEVFLASKNNPTTEGEPK